MKIPRKLQRIHRSSLPIFKGALRDCTNWRKSRNGCRQSRYPKIARDGIGFHSALWLTMSGRRGSRTTIMPAKMPSLKEIAFLDLQRELAVTRTVLQRLPEEHYQWKPHEKSMSLGSLALHVAFLPDWMRGTLAEDVLDVTAAPARPRNWPIAISSSTSSIKMSRPYGKSSKKSTWPNSTTPGAWLAEIR